MYPVSSYNGQDDRFCKIFRDYSFTCPSRRVARATTKAGANTWLYQFVHKSLWNDDQLVNHGDELFFVFNNAPSDAEFSKSDEYVSSVFGNYWSNMVYSLFYAII